MQEIKTDIVIVGSGAGGATLAKELSGGTKQVVLLEQGPFLDEESFGTEILAYNFYDKHGLWSKTAEGVFYYRTLMAGGTTVVSCANALQTPKKEQERLGIDLEEYFTEAKKDLCVTILPESFLKEGSRKIMEVAEKLGYQMSPMPKAINFSACISCGNCILGCKTGAKWSSLNFIKDAQKKGVIFINNTQIDRVLLEDGYAIGVQGHSNIGERIIIHSRIVVLAAGGIGTPIILQNSGIAAGQSLFLDLFTVTIGLTSNISLTGEIPMSLFYQEDGFILSTFIDTPMVAASVIPAALRKTLKLTQRDRMVGIMVKIADDTKGKVSADGIIYKTITDKDKEKLCKGQTIAKNILINSGADPKTILVSRIRGAHPGGTAAIGEVVDTNLETKIKRLFVCDCSVLPTAPGLPPILTIVALAKRLSQYLKRI
ncbi:MAG: GMC family oxidoreductase N-terminal domain-containing protein [Candidatus Omnitrophica bacterium]|nr:GMC family oxidoreductase N-terminal domain-containing protein [Candidatus Omnitrophota bacterium]